MSDLRYTLLSDGSSDQALMPILSWLVHEHLADYAIQSEWSDLRRLPDPPKSLIERIEMSLELYPCDLLFVHRDAERAPLEERVQEIRNAVEGMPTPLSMPPAVCVVPVRMQEAWLLFDEDAIREAAGNPKGKQRLELPPIEQLERLPDPKSILHGMLRSASGRTGRRMKKLPISTIVRRVPECILDFSPLRSLPAFRALESEIVRVIQEQGWNALDEFE